jgi:hypothetical protein
MNNAKVQVRTRTPQQFRKSRGGSHHGRPDEAHASDASLLHCSGHLEPWIERWGSIRLLLLVACLILILGGQPLVSFAQPVALSPTQLDQLVERIALYPDPLLANILTASTYWSEIPEAASWADQHSDLKGGALAQAMQADHFPASWPCCPSLRFWT